MEHGNIQWLPKKWKHKMPKTKTTHPSSVQEDLIVPPTIFLHWQYDCETLASDASQRIWFRVAFAFAFANWAWQGKSVQKKTTANQNCKTTKTAETSAAVTKKVSLEFICFLLPKSKGKQLLFPHSWQAISVHKNHAYFRHAWKDYMLRKSVLSLKHCWYHIERPK